MKLLVSRICEKCNNALGQTLDQVMSRESPQALNRALLGIKGRHTDEANIFHYKSQQPQPPVQITVAHPEHAFHPQVELIPGSDPPRTRIVEQLVFQKSDTADWESIRIRPINPADDGRWLKRAIQRRGLESARLVQMFCAPDDATLPSDERQPSPWLRKALLFAFPQAQEQAQQHGIRVDWLVDGDVETATVASQIKIRVTAEYARALAKIAFHYALTADHWITGHEAEFQPVRAFIRDGVGSPQQFVDLAARHFVIDSGAALKGTHHFLLLDINGAGELVVHMQFFTNGSRLSPTPQHALGVPPIRVALGRYPHLSARRLGHAIRLFGTPADRFDGEILRLELGKVGGEWGVITPPWFGRVASM